MRGIAVAELAEQKIEVKEKPDEPSEDLVGLVSGHKRKLFQSSNFGFSETSSTRTFNTLNPSAGLTTIKTFVPSSDCKSHLKLNQIGIKQSEQVKSTQDI
jgi:hypothetical protein